MVAQNDENGDFWNLPFDIGRKYDASNPIVVRNAALQSISFRLTSPDSYYIYGSLVFEEISAADRLRDGVRKLFGQGPSPNKTYDFTYPLGSVLSNRFSLSGWNAAAGGVPASQIDGAYEIVIAARRPRDFNLNTNALLGQLQDLSNATQLPVYFTSPIINGPRTFTPQNR